MARKNLITFFAAAITFLGSSQLLTAEQEQTTCQPTEPTSFVFQGDECPWDIGGICQAWGYWGAGTLGVCEPEGTGFRVTCSCVS